MLPSCSGQKRELPNDGLDMKYHKRPRTNTPPDTIANFQPDFTSTPMDPRHLPMAAMMMPPVPLNFGFDHCFANGVPASTSFGHSYMNNTPSTDSGLSEESVPPSPPPLPTTSGYREHADLNTSEGRREKYQDVSGRMCLLSGAEKYPVSMGEILRRINGPETLHGSLLNGILRVAKAKDNGNQLRRNLQNVGIVLPAGRRKSAPTTCFTALCEREALKMADQYANLLQQIDRQPIVADHMQQECFKLGPNPQFFLHSFMKYLESWIVRFESFPKEPEECMGENQPAWVQSWNKMNMLTHGFGAIAYLGVLKSFHAMMSDSISFIDKQYGVPQMMPMDPMSMMGGVTIPQEFIPNMHQRMGAAQPPQ